jgi:CHASE3 domain sensor protein
VSTLKVDQAMAPEVTRKEMLKSRRPELAAFPLIVAMLVIAGLAVRYQSQARWVRHTLDVEKSLEALQSALAEAEVDQKSFLLTGSREFLPPYDAALRSIPSEIADIQSLAQGNPQQEKLLSELRPLVDQRMARLKDRIREYLQGNPDLTNLATGERLMDQIRGKLAEMRSVEADRLAQRTERSRNLLLAGLTIMAGLLVLFSIVA